MYLHVNIANLDRILSQWEKKIKICWLKVNVLLVQIPAELTIAKLSRICSNLKCNCTFYEVNLQ